MAAAAELLAAAALPDAEEAAPLAVAEALPAAADAEEELLPEPATNSAVAFLEPQTKDWQKVWPARSLGWAAVHWARHSSHSRLGRVCA